MQHLRAPSMGANSQYRCVLFVFDYWAWAPAVATLRCPTHLQLSRLKAQLQHAHHRLHCPHTTSQHLLLAVSRKKQAMMTFWNPGSLKAAVVSKQPLVLLVALATAYQLLPPRWVLQAFRQRRSALKDLEPRAIPFRIRVAVLHVVAGLGSCRWPGCAGSLACSV